MNNRWEEGISNQHGWSATSERWEIEQKKTKLVKTVSIIGYIDQSRGFSNKTKKISSNFLSFATDSRYKRNWIVSKKAYDNWKEN